MLTDDLLIANTPRGSKKQEGPKAREVETHEEHPETDSPEHEEETEHPDESEHEHNPESDDGHHEEEHEEDESNSPEEHDHDSVADDTTFSIRDGDKDVNVTLAELKKGYTRQADYTRKMQTLADERKTLTQDVATAQGEREKYRAGLAQVQQAIAQLQPQEPTPEQWQALQQYDPVAYLQQKEQWREHKDKMSAIQAEYQALTQRQNADQQRQLTAHMAAEGEKLAAAFPEWKDKAKAQAGKQAIRDYAYSLGYSPEEVDTTADHRIFVLAHKAMMYDRMVAKGKPQPQQPQNKTKVVRPGNAGQVPNTRRAAVTDARKTLRQTGKVQDAASLLEKLL